MTTAGELRMNQVTIAVTDVGRALRFYSGLGLIPIIDGSDYARLVVPGGGATCSLDRVDGPVTSNTVVYFECDELEQKVADLEAAGYVFDEQPTAKPWLWHEARLHDPDGNPVCLYFAGDNRLNPPWRVRASRDHHVLSRARFQRWLEGYCGAWMSRDEQAAGQLFTADAQYHETPFGTPMNGREEIVTYWRGAVADQRDITCQFEVIHAEDRTGYARWTTKFVNHRTGKRYTLDGMFEISFDSDGRATCLREWWHSKSNK